jgi:hypothetical protein
MEEAMRRILLMLMLITIVYGQEVYSRVKVDRRTESALATLFDRLPNRIDVFMSTDSVYSIEATYDGLRIVMRLTFEEYRDLVTKTPPKMVTLENARVPFLVGQTLLGLGVYSWGIPVTFGMEDKNAVVIGLFTPLAYASAHFFLSQGKRISGGAAYGSFVGGLVGGAHGGLLFKSVKGIFPVSLTENTVDLLLGQAMGFTPAMFHRKFSYCAYGYYHYYAVRTLISGWDNWEDKEDIMTIGTLVSVAEGYTALFLSKRSDYLTYGDALFEFRTAVMGAEFVPLLLATVDLHRDEQTDERIYAALSLTGYSVGYMLGKRLTRDYDLSGAAGVLTWILPYLAHSATAGLVALTESEGLARSYPAIFLTIDVGLTYVCYKAFAEKADRIGKVDSPRLNISLKPLCLLSKNSTLARMPLCSVSYRL